MKKLFVISTLALLFTSCEKVIDVDLNSADPQTVFEANLQEGSDTLWFYMSQTADYFGNEEPPTLDGAAIEFTDAGGVVHTAQGAGNGTYYVRGINASAEATYSVAINYENEITTAQSYMPPVVPLDADTVEVFFAEAEGFFEEGYRIRVGFQEPADAENYYRIVVQINGEERGDLILFDDQFSQGNYLSFELTGYDIEEDDIVQVELRSIDAAVYKYYLSVDDILGQNGPPGIAPANPITNLEGDIQLGYFGTYSASAITDTAQ